MSTATAINGIANESRSEQEVYLSHPPQMDISVIRRVLKEEGVRVWSEELAVPNQPIRESLIEGMTQADALIVVLDDSPPDSSVFYEMGLADALRKPVLVVSAQPFDPSSDIGLYPYLRARSNDENALRFGLSHFLRAPRHSTSPEEDNHTNTTKPLGDAVDPLLARLRAEPNLRGDELIKIIFDAIQESGVETLANNIGKKPVGDTFADIAVWSDDLSALVGNPLPIDVRESIPSPEVAEKVAKNLTRVITTARVRWGLILFREATPVAQEALRKHPVLAMSIEDFLEGLRNQSYAQIITGLRNRTVHGVRVDG